MRFLLVVLLVSIVSCSNESKKLPPSEATLTNLCRHSNYLSIYKLGNGYRIRVQDPDNKNKHFQLTIFEPASHLAVLSATHIGMLSALNQEKKIAAITDIRYVYSPKVKKRFKQKHIIELQNEQMLSVDQLLKSQSEYLIYSAFSGSFTQEKRLGKLGIQCIPDFDWREQSALGRAEWILLFGALTGTFQESINLFKSIEKSYEKKRNTGVQTDQMVSGNVTGDFWYAPAGKSFMAELFRNSGLNYVYGQTKGTGSLAYSMEKIMKDGSKVKLWLNPGFSSKKEILMVNPKAKYMPFYEGARIFCYTHNTNKFWEMSTLRPDWLMEDLIKIANENSPQNLHFYKEVK